MFEQPSESRLALSRQLEARIRDEIQNAGGWIDFEQYMELALFAPGLGYYAANPDVFGEAGDYVTAPGLGGLFAACLATQVAAVLTDAAFRPAASETAGSPEILEFGAGNGDLAARLLLELEQLDALPERYGILETGAALRRRQQECIQALPRRLADRVQWLEALPDSIDGVVVANEVLDAMPFHRFRVGSDDQVNLLGVTSTAEGFRWAEGDCPAELKTSLQTLSLPQGYESEWNQMAPAWVRSVGERIRCGVMLLVDYGYDRSTFFHPDRRTGTMHCHYRHHAHDDPFLWPGLQDITAHVDFTAVAEAGTATGLELMGYLDQASFMIGAGFSDIYAARHAAAGVDTVDAMALASEAKRLVMPQEMGEQFKVIALGRGCAAPGAFYAQDQSHRLVA